MLATSSINCKQSGVVNYDENPPTQWKGEGNDMDLFVVKTI